MSQEFLPLLKPENIDQLKSLILQIMEDNDSKLEKIIENKQNQAIQQGFQFTLQDLNDLLSEQCLQKQKIVSNLSHFALSLMNTIEVLWQDNQDLEYKIKDQRQLIQEMNNHLHEISKEGDYLKNKLHMAYNDLHKIEEQKHAVQEYLSSIVAKQDSSFYLKQQMKISSNIQQNKINDLMSEEQCLKAQNHSQRNSLYDNENEGSNKLQNSISIIQKSEKYRSPDNEIDLLQESVIKESISVLRRFTLQDQIQNKIPTLQESENQIKFIQKSNRFSVINEISLQIFQQTKSPQKDKYIIQPSSLIKIPVQERSAIRDLRISNEKINITIATKTQISKTKDSDKNHYEQFSMIQQSPSCTSIILPRQNSAIMYPPLQKASSSISFVTHTTKQIQTDLPKIKEQKKQFKKAQSKSIGIDTSTIIESQSNHKKEPQKKYIYAKAKKEQTKKPDQEPKSQQASGRKSFSQLLDFFTKKIVSDRIRTGIRKDDLGGFKKTKSNIQKVF